MVGHTCLQDLSWYQWIVFNCKYYFLLPTLETRGNSANPGILQHPSPVVPASTSNTHTDFGAGRRAAWCAGWRTGVQSTRQRAPEPPGSLCRAQADARDSYTTGAGGVSQLQTDFAAHSGRVALPQQSRAGTAAPGRPSRAAAWRWQGSCSPSQNAYTFLQPSKPTAACDTLSCSWTCRQPCAFLLRTHTISASPGHSCCHPRARSEQLSSEQGHHLLHKPKETAPATTALLTGKLSSLNHLREVFGGFSAKWLLCVCSPPSLNMMPSRLGIFSHRYFIPLQYSLFSLFSGTLLPTTSVA